VNASTGWSRGHGILAAVQQSFGPTDLNDGGGRDSELIHNDLPPRRGEAGRMRGLAQKANGARRAEAGVIKPGQNAVQAIVPASAADSRCKDGEAGSVGACRGEDGSGVDISTAGPAPPTSSRSRFPPFYTDEGEGPRDGAGDCQPPSSSGPGGRISVVSDPGEGALLIRLPPPNDRSWRRSS